MDTYVTSLQIGYFFFGTYREQNVCVLFRVLIFQQLQRTKRSCSISGTSFSAPTENKTFVFYIGYLFFSTYREQDVRVLFRVFLFQQLQRTKRSCSISGTYFSAPTENKTFVFYFGYFFFSNYREQNLRVLFRALLFQHLQRTRRSCSISGTYFSAPTENKTFVFYFGHLFFSTYREQDVRVLFLNSIKKFPVNIWLQPPC
jgi:hypothetical protein